MKSNSMLRSFLLGTAALSILTCSSVYATTYYWDAGAGTAVWGTATNQATTFGGGTDLKWSAVPEPTSTLAGLLIGFGLMRRRRIAKCI